jgi:cell division septal protein FtsQ
MKDLNYIRESKAARVKRAIDRRARIKTLIVFAVGLFLGWLLTK